MLPDSSIPRSSERESKGLLVLEMLLRPATESAYEARIGSSVAP